MTRDLTNAEKVLARQHFPRMNVDAVAVTDEATSKYNCLAWTLGITTSWIWPWPGAYATKDEFDDFYSAFGFAPINPTGNIAALGLSFAEMAHGCASGPDFGPR